MKDDDLDDRLARLRVEQADPGQGGQQGVISRAAALWERYSRRRRRGDPLLVTSALLIAGVLIAALSVLVISIASGGGEKQPAVAVGEQRTPTALRQVSSSETTPALETPLPATAQPAVRQDCDAVRGTSYQSEAERVYFEQYCITPAAPANAGGGQTVDEPSDVPPAPTNIGSSASPAAEAVNLAVDWITSNAPVSYTADANSCTAIDTQGHWVVTCSARLAGCQGAVCEQTISVCVTLDPLVVVPADRC